MTSVKLVLGLGDTDDKPPPFYLEEDNSLWFQRKITCAHSKITCAHTSSSHAKRKKITTKVKGFDIAAKVKEDCMV